MPQVDEGGEGMYTVLPVIYATQKFVKNGNLWILFMHGSTWSMAVDIHVRTLCELYLCDFSLIRIIA